MFGLLMHDIFFQFRQQCNALMPKHWEECQSHQQKQNLNINAQTDINKCVFKFYFSIFKSSCNKMVAKTTATTDGDILTFL